MDSRVTTYYVPRFCHLLWDSHYLNMAIGRGGALGANSPHLESQNPFLVFEGLHDVSTMGRLVCVISAHGKVDTRTTFHFSASVSVRGMPIWKGIYVFECDRLLHVH